MGSTRLPGKVLMDLGGKPVLKWVVDAARQSKVDHIIVATPDQQIMDYCEGLTVHSVLGPEDDVLKRFEIAAQGHDTIVRLTADCPFIDPWLIDQCIANFSCTTKEWPDGMDVQVLRSAWLPLGDREHVVPVNNNLSQLPCPMGNLRHVRLTLDTFSDLERLRLIAQRLPRDRAPGWLETIEAYSELKRAA